MSMVETQKLHYDYLQYGEEGAEPVITHAIRGVDLKVEEGQFIAVIGRNGCGKSTLARHINALLLPTEGIVRVAGMDTKDESDLLKIRQSAGMVFQNPDNQIIASVVEEDVAFGPENMGVPTDEIWERVDEALRLTQMAAYREHSPNRLSGGQKQRVAIAGVMAMRPRCIILDEPTAMLDPLGRREVLAAMHDLNRAHGVTIILITHYMEEITDADRIFVMDAGRIVLSGDPREIFAHPKELEEAGLELPQVTALADALKKDGLPILTPVLAAEDLADQIAEIAGQKNFESKKTAGQSEPALQEAAANYMDASPSDEAVKSLKAAMGSTDHRSGAESKQMPQEAAAGQEQQLLELDHISYLYSTGTAYEIRALDDVSLTIGSCEAVGIIGHTGSGKSTLIQHLNGLVRPTEGAVRFRGKDIWSDGYRRKELRFHVGMVFQYPEYQLFEISVIKDVCFGPKNQGLSDAECLEKAKRALEQVGIGEELYEKSPLEMSGGQKRRVAIAGVLAMDPDVLVLDEPTAGLDPAGKREIFSMIARLRKTRGITIVLVSHSMEDVAMYVDRLVVMDHGKKAFDGPVREVFRKYRELEAIGLSAPQVTYLVHALKKRGLYVDTDAITVPEAEETILQALGKSGAAAAAAEPPEAAGFPNVLEG